MPRDIFSQVAPPADVRVPYGSDSNQFGDLRLPKGAGTGLPVVIFIHGGFWREQFSLEHAGHAAVGFTEEGYACWNIEYRRIGNLGGGWPGTFLDVAAAVDYLREIAPEYGLDLDRVVVAGHSAGGHLAAWATSRHRIPMGDPLYTDNPLPLKGAVPLAGVVDLRMGYEFDLSNGVVEQFIGGTPDALPHRYATASPIELLPCGVPQALVHGTRDSTVPYEISQHYVEVATQRGDNARLITLPNAGHFEVVNPDTKEWKQVVRAVGEVIRN